MDFQAHDAEAKLLSQRRNKETLLRALEDRRGECGHLVEKIGKLRSEVALAKSVKYARDQARGESGDAVGLAAAKMKKVCIAYYVLCIVCCVWCISLMC
jgi:hypothetical protein